MIILLPLVGRAAGSRSLLRSQKQKAKKQNRTKSRPLLFFSFSCADDLFFSTCCAVGVGIRHFVRRAEAMSLVSTTLVGIAVAERVRHLCTGPTDTVALVRSPRGGVGFPSDRPPLRPGKIRVSILQDHHRAIPAWCATCR